MDHTPPHFHVRLNDGREAFVAIDSLEILFGKVSEREIADALSWAGQNQTALLNAFMELQQ